MLISYALRDEYSTISTDLAKAAKTAIGQGVVRVGNTLTWRTAKGSVTFHRQLDGTYRMAGNVDTNRVIKGVVHYEVSKMQKR